jgi:hypothetical protein
MIFVGKVLDAHRAGIFEKYQHEKLEMERSPALCEVIKERTQTKSQCSHTLRIWNLPS